MLFRSHVDGNEEDYCLVDLKEAVKASAPHATRAKMPSDQAARVVEGARHLSPYLGDRMLAGKLDGNSVFVRELMPQDREASGLHHQGSDQFASPQRPRLRAGDESNLRAQTPTSFEGFSELDSSTRTSPRRQITPSSRSKDRCNTGNPQ